MSYRSRLVLAALLPLAPAACGEQKKTATVPDYVCESVALTPVPLGQKLIIAHRGASKEYPENSEEALLAAGSLGANAVEFDVVMSQDGVPVVMHDATLDRTTDCSGAVADLTWAEIAPCRLDGRYQVPRLDWLLPKLLGYRRVFVEIKGDEAGAAVAAQAVGGVVRDLVAYDQVVVTSYDLRTLYELKTRFPEPRIHIGYDGAGAALPLATVNMGFDYMLMSAEDIGRCTFSTAEQMGVKLVTYTVQDREDLFALNEGLFGEYAAGIMFDDLRVLRDNRDDLERKLGKHLRGPRDCKSEGHVWDKEHWECLDACTQVACPEGSTCDPETGLCRADQTDVAGLQALFAELGPLVEAGRAAHAAGDEAALAAAEAQLQARVDPASPYHDRVELLSEMLFSADDPRAEILDWESVGGVTVSHPRATISTAAGTEWFFWYSDGAWRLAFVQTP